MTGGLDSPRGIALDVAAGRMYWADGGTEKIQSANLDGSGVTDLLTGVEGLYGIALDLSFLFADGFESGDTLAWSAHVP